MDILRKYKIYSIFNILNHQDEEVINFISSWFDDLEIFESTYYPESTFYMTRNGRFVFETTTRNEDVIIRWKDLIEILYIKYNISEFFKLFQYILKSKYNIILKSMLCKDKVDFLKIEYEFDKKIQNI